MDRLLPNRAIAVLAALTVTLTALSVSLLLWQTRRHGLEAARLQTASIAHMLREQTERNFESADQVLHAVQERMQTNFGAKLPLDGAAVRLLLASRVLASRSADVLAIVDQHGRVVNASRDDMPLAESIADAPYFRTLAHGGADGLVVGGPVRTPRGDWTLDLARPLVDAHGAFRGAVVLTMKVPRLEQFYDWIRVDYQRPIALHLADGTLLASLPARDALIGQRPPEFTDSTPRPGDSANVHAVSVVSRDGGTRELALARVGTFPLMVSVTADEQPALAAWREQSIPIVLGALLVCSFTVAAAGVLASHLRREARLSRALRDANDRYHRTIETMRDAVVGVDGSHIVTMFNPAAERMFGLRASEVIGTPVTRLLPERVRGDHSLHVEGFLGTTQSPRNMATGTDAVALRADGTEFPIECAISRTEFGGRVEVTAVLRDVTERRRAEQELRDSNRQLRALASSLQDVREQERSRIAVELHDELGQQLTGLKLELSWLAARVKEGRALAAEQVDGMRQQLDTSIASVRRIATELRPRVLDDLGFGAAVAWHAAEFTRRTGIAVDLDLDAAGEIADGPTATALFRIVQESLTNVARHAQADSVAVSLQVEDGGAVLRIEDDGRGFDTALGGAGFGLLGMRERAMAVGARLAIRSAPGKGTAVEVSLPLYESVGIAALVAS